MPIAVVLAQHLYSAVGVTHSAIALGGAVLHGLLLHLELSVGQRQVEGILLRHPERHAVAAHRQAMRTSQLRPLLAPPSRLGILNGSLPLRPTFLSGEALQVGILEPTMGAVVF